MLTRTPPTSARPAPSRAASMADARPRDWVTARLQVSAPGQLTTSRASSAPGRPRPRASRPAYSSGSWPSSRPRNTTFWRLVTRTSAPRRRWRAARPVELLGGHVTQAAVGVGRHRAPGHAPHDVGPLPSGQYGLPPVISTGTAPGRAEPARSRRGRRRPARRPPRSTTAGTPPGQPAAARRRRRSLSTRVRTSSMPRVSTSHFMRARSLLSRLPAWSNTRRIASMRGQQVVPGGELLQGLGRVRRGAEAAGHEDPEAGLGRAVGPGPGHGHHPDVVEHRLPAVGGAAREVDLELAGEALAVGVAEEVPERRLGPGADVEHLERAGPGQVAAGHVADGVAAGLPRRQPHRRRGRA